MPTRKDNANSSRNITQSPKTFTSASNTDDPFTNDDIPFLRGKHDQENRN